MTHLAILCVRNEAAFLLEWLAHHRAVGFDHFLVFSNNCDDGTDDMLDHISELGWLTHVRNDPPYDQRGIQFTALNRAAKHPVVKAADWVMVLDVDEFVNIHCGDHSVSALHRAIPDATAITLTWRLFGANGQVRFQDRPVLDTFTMAAPRVIHWPWRATMFKTLYRNDGTYAKPGVHRPRAPDHARLPYAHWADGNGKQLPETFKTKRVFSDYGRDNFGLVQLNHYPLGAFESYMLKADRGRVNVEQDKILGLDYWVERNYNIEQDTTINAIKERREEQLSFFKADSILNQLHDESVSWRKAKFDALMSEERYRALYYRLLMTPPSQPIQESAAAFVISHALGTSKS